MEETTKILYVNSEIFPFMPETRMSNLARFLPQGIQETGKEIRSFMPRYGCINERRNQLHEVIRLSGLNLVVNNADKPLIIKVSSISSARMQVYFIDNEDYFHRKQMAADVDGKFFEDNDERAIFFAMGVLETVKKLRWKPDIVHCQGWITQFLPFMIKKVYSQDPVFSDTKVVLSIYNEYLDEKFCNKLTSKLSKYHLNADDTALLCEPTGIKLAEFGTRYSDGIVVGEETLSDEAKAVIAKSGLPCLEYIPNNKDGFEYVPFYNNFYEKILGNND